MFITTQYHNITIQYYNHGKPPAITLIICLEQSRTWLRPQHISTIPTVVLYVQYGTWSTPYSGRGRPFLIVDLTICFLLLISLSFFPSFLLYSTLLLFPQYFSLPYFLVIKGKSMYKSLTVTDMAYTAWLYRDGVSSHCTSGCPTRPPRSLCRRKSLPAKPHLCELVTQPQLRVYKVLKK